MKLYASVMDYGYVRRGYFWAIEKACNFIFCMLLPANLFLIACLLYIQAELQKMRVEMAAMKRDAEHYSREVTIFITLILNFFCLKAFSYQNIQTVIVERFNSSI